MVRVTLTTTEMMQAALIGSMRHVQCLKNDRTEQYGVNPEYGWQFNIQGALGEMVIAKHLGLYFGGVGIFGGLDVGKYEVRANHRDNGDLILHPNDKDDAIFWLVTGVNGHFTIRGNITGRIGKDARWWRDGSPGRPAFFVPQSALDTDF